MHGRAMAAIVIGQRRVAASSFGEGFWMICGL
jgi:hypothetical protein